MSGFEALGIAASIIQVADLGTKLSVKLFSFYRELKGAIESIQNLSSDVAITSAILRELGESLKEDEQAKLYSKKAFETLKDILTQCEEVLEQICDITKYNESSEKTRLQQITERFRQILLEPSVVPLKAKLKRLKSTMLLLLNVIMYAGQIRSNNVPTMLQEQRDFIKSLLEEKQKGDAKIMATPAPLTINASLDPRVGPWANSALKNGEPSDLDEYSLLMQNMLQQINSCKSRLEQNRHSRIRSGVLNIHSREILQFQLHHGQSIMQRFDHSLFFEEQSSPTKFGSRSIESEPSTYTFGSEEVLLDCMEPTDLDTPVAGQRYTLESSIPIADDSQNHCSRVLIEPYPHDSDENFFRSHMEHVGASISMDSIGTEVAEARRHGSVPLSESQSFTSNSPRPLDSDLVEASVRTYPSCTSSPFQTQFVFDSYDASIPLQGRPHICPVDDSLLHRSATKRRRINPWVSYSSPGYSCPFCPVQQHWYPQPDDLQRHVQVYHTDKENDDPILREALATRAPGSPQAMTLPSAGAAAGRPRLSSHPKAPSEFLFQTSNSLPQGKLELLSLPLDCSDPGPWDSLPYNVNTETLPPSEADLSKFRLPRIETISSPCQTNNDPLNCLSIDNSMDGMETLHNLVLEWTTLRQEEILE